MSVFRALAQANHKARRQAAGALSKVKRVAYSGQSKARGGKGGPLRLLAACELSLLRRTLGLQCGAVHSQTLRPRAGPPRCGSAAGLGQSYLPACRVQTTLMMVKRTSRLQRGQGHRVRGDPSYNLPALPFWGMPVLSNLRTRVQSQMTSSARFSCSLVICAHASRASPVSL